MTPKTKKLIRIDSILAKTRVGPACNYPSTILRSHIGTTSFYQRSIPCRQSNRSLVLNNGIIHAGIPEYAGMLFPSSYSKAQMSSISIAPSDAIYRLTSIPNAPSSHHSRSTSPLGRPQTVSANKRLPQTPRRLRITIISTYPPRSVGLPHNKDTKQGFHNA